MARGRGRGAVGGKGSARNSTRLRRDEPHVAAGRGRAKARRRPGSGGARKPAALGCTGQRVTTARPAARLRRRGRRPATGH
ncbi:hypothetical protein KV205_05925, partial [Streptomyces sp. SKN60]|uniref:hypothetical protein n=1 Tax=Streptomyces sp. SKN60 TaxID=2855506 RepID=UPI002248015C